MYISRVEIDVCDREKMWKLSHAGAYHSWVEDSFPSEKQGGKRTRKLWRVDRIQGKDYLLLVSEEKPSQISFEEYGVLGTGTTKNYDTFLSRLKEGEKMRFRLAFNPVVARSQEGEKRGRLYPLVGSAAQIEFLEKRCEKHGFSIFEDTVSVVRSRYETLKKAKQNPEHFLKVEVEGILKIQDIQKFKKVLVNELGKRKAYGCGLLTVISVKSNEISKK